MDELRGRARELEERERRESKKLADEDALRRIRLAEEQIEHLQRKLAATKQARPPHGTPASGRGGWGGPGIWGPGVQVGGVSAPEGPWCPGRVFLTRRHLRGTVSPRRDPGVWVGGISGPGDPSVPVPDGPRSPGAGHLGPGRSQASRRGVSHPKWTQVPGQGFSPPQASGWEVPQMDPGVRVGLTPLLPRFRRQEEEALLSEMDVTGQAFEDMQEQNLRLLQQLREKDDANFKLMSERIKANQIHKLLRDEKDELADQVLALKAQVRPPSLRTQASGLPAAPQMQRTQVSRLLAPSRSPGTQASGLLALLSPWEPRCPGSQPYPAPREPRRPASWSQTAEPRSPGPYVYL